MARAGPCVIGRETSLPLRFAAYLLTTSKSLAATSGGAHFRMVFAEINPLIHYININPSLLQLLVLEAALEGIRLVLAFPIIVLIQSLQAVIRGLAVPHKHEVVGTSDRFKQDEPCMRVSLLPCQDLRGVVRATGAPVVTRLISLGVEAWFRLDD